MFTLLIAIMKLRKALSTIILFFIISFCTVTSTISYCWTNQCANIIYQNSAVFASVKKILSPNSAFVNKSCENWLSTGEAQSSLSKYNTELESIISQVISNGGTVQLVSGEGECSNKAFLRILDKDPNSLLLDTLLIKYGNKIHNLDYEYIN